MEGLTTALTTAFGTVQTEATSAIGAVLPYALGILAAIIVINVAIRVFRRIAG